MYILEVIDVLNDKTFEEKYSSRELAELNSLYWYQNGMITKIYEEI